MTVLNSNDFNRKGNEFMKRSDIQSIAALIKTRHFAVITFALTAAISMSSFAGEWKQEADGRWWYQNDDGSYPTNSWQKIDNKDYYFDAEGWMLSNTTTPDGYQVGADGAWIENNSSTEAQQPAATSTSSNSIASNFTDYQLATYFDIEADGRLKYKAFTGKAGLSDFIFWQDGDKHDDHLDYVIVDNNGYVLGPGWYKTWWKGTTKEGTYEERPYYHLVGTDYKVVRNNTQQVDLSNCIELKNEKTDAEYKNTNTTNSSTTTQSSSSSKGTSLAAQDFRSIKRQYPAAEPNYAYAIDYKDSNGDSVTLVYLGYKIISNYSETFLHNHSTGKYITDPVSYYDKMAKRAFGANKVRYIDLSSKVKENEIKALRALQSILKNGNNSESGVYVSAETLSLGT